MSPDQTPASSWHSAFGQRVGHELKTRRQQLGLSAAKLAERTEELGYPISRVLIAKIENGHRAGLEVAELVILAAALEVPPVQLLFGDLAGGQVEVLPGIHATCWDAIKWTSGEAPLLVTPEGHDPYEPSRPGTPEDIDAMDSDSEYYYLAEDSWSHGGGERLRLLREHDSLFAKVMADQGRVFQAMTMTMGGGAPRAGSTREHQELIARLQEIADDGSDQLRVLRDQMTELGMSLPMQMTPGVGFFVDGSDDGNSDA